MGPGAKQEKQNPAEVTETPGSGNPALFPACLLRLTKKSWSLQKGVEETSAEAPFVRGHPSLPSRDFSRCEAGGPPQSFTPKQFYSVTLEDKSSQQKPPPCAEPS